MKPLPLAASSPSSDPPHADRASSPASTAITPGAPPCRTRRASRLPNIGCVESILSLMAAPVRGSFAATLPVRQRTREIAICRSDDAVTAHILNCCGRLARQGVDNDGNLANTSLHGEL